MMRSGIGILATIVAAIMSLFGGHQIIANSGSLPAAGAAAVAPIVSVEPASTSSPLAIAASPTTTTTIIQQPVIERIVEKAVPSPSNGDTISPAQLATALSGLTTIFAHAFTSSQVSAAIPQQVAAGGNPVVYNFPPVSQRIDNLSNTAISNPSITGGSISGGSISGASVAGYLPLGGGTLTGTLSGTDLNLGIATFLNGTKVDAIQLDTSTTSTSTIDYVVTDQFGTTATATRTVIVQ